MLNRRQFTGGVVAATYSASVALAKPFGMKTVSADGAATPSITKLQQAFLDLRFGMYIHLNMATFEEREWGDP